MSIQLNLTVSIIPKTSHPELADSPACIVRMCEDAMSELHLSLYIVRSMH